MLPDYARFWGSKTVFVAFTDGYHLTRMIDRSAMILSVGIGAGELKEYKKKDRWKLIYGGRHSNKANAQQKVCRKAGGRNDNRQLYYYQLILG